MPLRLVALAADHRQDHSPESRAVEGNVEAVRKRPDRADERSTTAAIVGEGLGNLAGDTIDIIRGPKKGTVPGSGATSSAVALNTG